MAPIAFARPAGAPSRTVDEAMRRSPPESLEVTAMTALIADSLATDALARRLADLAGDERHVIVEFLSHLEVFDRRRAWAEAGFPSLWEYVQRVLHLREGAAWRRITAMRTLRRFPQLADALRDARLCLSTLALLAPVLTDDNVAEVMAAAAFASKRDVERLVAGLAPRPAPREGVRKLPARADERVPAALPLEVAPSIAATSAEPTRSEPCGPAVIPALEASPPPKVPRPTVRPVSADSYSLSVTLDAAFKAEIDELAALLGHKVASGHLGEVLRIAVQCAIEKYGKRKGAKPVRKTAPAAAEEAVQGAVQDVERRESASRAARSHVPAAVRREVWARDGGQCTWLGLDGQRCPARTKLELDHIEPVALGGRSSAENLRLTCKAHNFLHAERTFGREYMARFRRVKRQEEVTPKRH
jgi:5-methylcytosine-specific restriction endonuclease McrA